MTKRTLAVAAEKARKASAAEKRRQREAKRREKRRRRGAVALGAEVAVRMDGRTP
jgi:hypothetical protein